MSTIKISAVATAVALAVSSQAFAFTDPATAEVTLYMSGASAPTHMLREQVVQNLCSAGSPINVYIDEQVQAPNGNVQLLFHRELWTVQCTGRTGTDAAGKLLRIAKTDNGGSGQGVTPVANATVKNYLDTAACNAVAGIGATAGNGSTAYTYRVCGSASLLSQIPDMGVSDVEPTVFRGTLASGSDFVQPANWETEPGPGLVFGIVVTTEFRNHLQDNEITLGRIAATCDDSAENRELESCMPSLPSWYVRSVFTGRINNWSQEEIYGLAPNPALSGNEARVNICRRTQGSGTHATQMIHFNRTNCNRTGTLGMLGQPGNVIGSPFVYENTSAGNVDLCLQALNNGTTTTNTIPAIGTAKNAFAIGYQSLEKNADRSLPYRFVQIDDVTPSLQNVFNGDYDIVYFLSYNHRPNDFRTGGGRSGFTAGEEAIIEAVIDNGFDLSATVVAQLNTGFNHSFGTSGFVVPVAGSAAPAVFSVNDPRVPFNRLNTSNTAPDSCQPLYRR
jgi:hypothetical protein